ncbi:MAG: PHP domain-containing protein [Bacteroidales bacterium]
MKEFRADLHIHSVLSPCGDLEMSPRNIIKRALEMKLDIIGISDHNSTKHGPLMRKIGIEEKIFVLTGAEVTSREEAHCLAFFENNDQLTDFQKYLDEKIIPFPNDTQRFGHQVVVDENEIILHEEENLLFNAIDQSVEEIEQMVHMLGGLFIPAHINRTRNSLISQLGFVPSGLKADALELSRHISKEEFLGSNQYLKDYTFLHSSDAHFPEDIGIAPSVFQLQEISFSEIRMALANEGGRKVIFP